MRIGILSYGLHKGGRGRTLAQLANGLARRGHDPYLMVLEGQPIAYPVDVPALHVPFFGPEKIPRADVLIPGALGLIPLTLARPEMVTVPLHFRFEPDVAYDQRTAALITSLPYRSMATTVPMADRIQQYTGLPCHPVLPGVDTNVFTPGSGRRDRRKRVGYLYRPTALGYGFKGSACLWEAIQRVTRVEPEVEVRLLAPDGLPVDAPIQATVVEASSDEALVHFYRDLDLFVTTSRSDGAQLAVLEAMACGTPIVATDGGGLRDYATPGINCFMGMPEDAAMLSDLILAGLREHEMASRFAENALKTAQTRTWVSFVNAVERALRTALTGRVKGG